MRDTSAGYQYWASAFVMLIFQLHAIVEPAVFDQQAYELKEAYAC